MKNQEEFEKIRQELSEDIVKISKKIKYTRDFIKIKKAVSKNMIEGPPMLFGGLNTTNSTSKLPG